MSECGFDTGYSYCKKDRPCAEHSQLVCVECGAQADHVCGHGSNYCECSRPLCKNHGMCAKHKKEFDIWMRKIEAERKKRLHE